MTIKKPNNLWRTLCISIIAAAALMACAPAAPIRSSLESAAPAAPAAQAPAEEVQSADSSGYGNVAQQDQRRLIIRNADLTIVVTDTQAQLNEINKIATEFGGYIANTSTSKVRENALQANVTLRVEGKQLDAALDRIRKLAIEVRNENIRGDDVTAEFVDLEAQLKNLEAAEAQLQEIMKRSERTEDVMMVFQQLTEIRGRIEQIKGRMKFLSESAALATITLNLIPDIVAQPVQVAGWRPEGVAKQALQTLIGALQGLANLAIWFVIFVLPILLVLALPVVVVVVILRNLLRRRGNAKASAKARTQDPSTNASERRN
jgi:hypothetical protein